jgi:predicted RNase H-like HicB family nuclease
MKTLINPPKRKVTQTRVTGIIERSPNLYSIYIEEDLPGVGLFGYGDSEEEAKKDLLVAVEEYKEMLQEKGKPIPDFLNNLEITYRYSPELMKERFFVEK